MKKPEKKEVFGDWHCRDRLRQYNQGIIDYEKFLPSEEEIIKLLAEYNQENQRTIFITTSQTKTRYPIQFNYDLKGLAKAIVKRLGK